MAVTLELNTLRQSSARHWRIGQVEKCRTVLLYYAGTAQQNAISLMAKKLLAAEYLEGNLEGGGILEEDEESSMELAIVRQLAAGIAGKVPEDFKNV